MTERTHSELIEAARDARDWLVEALNRRANGGDVDELLQLAHDRLERMNLGDGDPDQTPNGAERWTPECAAGTGARVDAPAVERLDYSKPPPGYEVRESEVWVGWVWKCNDCTSRPARESEAAARAAAWAHYKARHDPPGMFVDVAGFGLDTADERLGFRDAVDWSRRGTAQATTENRAAAWAWHDRRLALADKLLDEDVRRVMEKVDDGCPLPGPNRWPRCLTWSDEQVAEVERWIAEAGELPEVLRG